MSEVKPVEKGTSRIKHLPTILLGLIVAGIFLMAIFSYQVTASEKALVLTMGRITAETGPGLHFRWPLPVQEILKYDVRLHSFDGRIGKLEETLTKDKRNVIVGIYLFYRIKDLKTFKNAAKSIDDAEAYMASQMRAVKTTVVGQYSFDEMINTDPKKMKLDQMKAKMLSMLAPDLLSRYGLEIVEVGIRNVGVPEKNAQEIAKTMKAERETEAKSLRAAGRTTAQNIRTNADKDRKEMLTKADAEAKKMMAEGDAQAAKYYSVFNEDPKLASFLRKLEAIKKIVGTKTTLVLDTNSAPFDIFQIKLDDAEKTVGPVTK